MPDKKISELPSSTALDGSESVPIVQGVITKKVPAKNIAKFGYQDVNTESGATRTLSLADRGSWIRFTNATACAITVPANSTAAFEIGETLNGIQAADGKLTFTGAAGVTINLPTDYKSNTRAKGAPFCLVKVATDTWDLIGDLEAL
jgi:hypothetical protein